MSSALGGAGGGGLLNTTQSNNANVAVYSSMLIFMMIHSMGSGIATDGVYSFCCIGFLWWDDL